VEKGPEAFRTISEAADDLDLPQHVLRFWETRFGQIKPMKRGGGRRYYRPEDIDLLRGIRHLLYEEGYTIRGVQRILKEQGNRFVIGIGTGEVSVVEAGAVVAVQEPELEAEEIPAQGSGRRAVPVEEFTNAGKSGNGILGRLRGKASPAGEDDYGKALSAEDRRNLQATLYELLECKRLLDQVRSN
jgi:DNA-binding transcriptional MerR regulator